MVENPRNGDLVKFWWDSGGVYKESQYIEGTVDVAIHKGHLPDKLAKAWPENATYHVRVICDDGGVHNRFNTELQYRCQYMNAYSVDRHYGGSEEGGWYYDAGDPVASMPYRNEHDGQRLRGELERMFPRTQGQGRFSVLGGYDFEVVSEDGFATSYPKERPHYE